MVTKLRFLSLICICCCSLLWSAPTIIEDKATIPVLTPSFEGRQTLKMQLDNGLQAYLISDPNVDKASAALVVKTGSWEDPKEYPGIAHFLEHMLFMGTKKYPQESDYDRFITEHGGLYNAFTSNVFTAYMFTVDNTALADALSRFSSFFTEPLFNPSGVDRELKAIDQEYAKNIENDDIREYYVQKEISNPTHPNHAFSMGNRASLLKVSQDTLKKWYKEHYSANRMRLEVISSLPIEKLKEIVVADFSEIPNKELSPIAIETPLFKDANKGHFVYIEPIKNVRQVTLMWELPPKFVDMRDTKPEAILSHILGHEGKKSLLAELKREKLAEGLRCGGEKLGARNMVFYIDIDLTDAGVRNVKTVIQRCFEAIANIKKKGIPHYIFDEMHIMSTLNYQYQPREEAFNHITTEAYYLANEEMETFPEQTLIIQKFDPAAVEEMLNALTPENGVYDVMAPKSLTGVGFDTTEPWINVPYTIKAISKETLEQWALASPNPQIDLPAPNPYIPDNVSAVSQKPYIKITDGHYVPRPTLLLNSDHGKIYFAQDAIYSVPKVSWIFEIKTPVINPAKAETIVLGDLFIKYATEALSAYTYPASIGGLNFNMDRTDNGISLRIDGYSDKAEDLFLDIVKTLKELRPREQKFKVYKDSLLRQYQDFLYEMPLVQDYEVLTSILTKDYVTSKEKASTLRKVTFDRLDEFVAAFFEKTSIEAVLYGNTNEQQANSLTKQLLDILGSQPYPKSAQPKKEVAMLPNDKGPFFVEVKSKVQGNAAILSIEMENFSFKARAAQQVLMQAIDEPFFSALRTKQQTGYIVLSQADEREQHLFDTFAVQSNTHDGRDLLARFELFLEGFLQELDKSEVPKTRFDNIKQALLTTLQQPPQDVKEMGALIFKLAFTYNGDFDRVIKRIKALENLTYSEFTENVRKVLGKENKRRLGVILSGEIPGDNSLQYSKLTNASKVKDLATYSPAFQENSHD